MLTPPPVCDAFLIAGSHNFHWSAFGGGQGLAEYSLGVADPRASSQFQQCFKNYWEKASPRQNQIPGILVIQTCTFVQGKNCTNG